MVLNSIFIEGVVVMYNIGHGGGVLFENYPGSGGELGLK